MERTIVKNALEQVAKKHGVCADEVKREIEMACMKIEGTSVLEGMRAETAEEIVEVLAKTVLERIQREL